MAIKTKPQTGAPLRRTSNPATRKPRLSAKNRALLALLNSPEWLIGTPEEAEEERETMEFLKTALDEDRPGYRKLFPKNEDER